MPNIAKISRLALCLATAASAPSPVIGGSPPVRDGLPTPQACEAYGYRAARIEEDRGGSNGPSVPLRRMRPVGKSSAPQASRHVAMEQAARDGPGYAMPAQPPPPMVTRYPANPVPTDTERYPHAVNNPIHQVAQDPVSTLSADVDTASYANVRRFLNDGQMPPSDAVRVEEMVNYFDYGYAAPTDRNVPFKSTVAVTASPWSTGHKIIHIGLQGFDIPRAEQPPLNLVFLIDTSGSMSSEDKLPLAQKAMNLLIDQLRPQDTVSMVAYAGSAGAVLGPTDGRQKLKMRCALGALQSGGSTAGGQGLALAYGLARENFDPKAVNRVVLMTDGDFNVGVSDPETLKDFIVEKRKTGVYLSVYGFGRGNYNDTLMQALAQNGNGTAGYIDSLTEARKTFRDDFAGSAFPIANDVKIQVEFNPRTVSEYRLIGYETRLLNREDFNNDQVDAGEVGSGTSVTALYEITPAGAKPSVDPLRYTSARPENAPANVGEYAFLKIRYKLPGQALSRLIDRNIGPADSTSGFDQAPESTRWAMSVAAFGQKLRHDPWISDSFGWRQIADLAQGARGQDRFGTRAEFVQLVRAADGVKSLNE